MDNILEVKGLCKNYTRFTLSDISFTVPSGYICGYVGRNGAGKTTTLDLITHQTRADAGEILIDGKTYQEDPVAYKEAIGYIGDSNYIVPEFMAGDLKRVMKEFYTTFDERKFTELIGRWELPLDKRIKAFSRGMKVRLMFAAVLSRETKLLILDEATNGLDPVMKEEILGILQEYISDGQHSVLFSTHILNDLEQIADYIFFLEKGKKVLYETREELAERYLLIKGAVEDLREPWKKTVIGLKTGRIGFEGIIRSEDAVFLPGDCLTEKASIDQIVIYLIREMEGKRV